MCPQEALNDADGDGICNAEDNRSGVSNLNQIDSDGDGVGTVSSMRSTGEGTEGLQAIRLAENTVAQSWKMRMKGAPVTTAASTAGNGQSAAAAR